MAYANGKTQSQPVQLGKAQPTGPASKPMPKGSQADHHVTTEPNHTKVVPQPTQGMPEKPTVTAADKAAKKKYGAGSWNNGYTN